MIALTILSVIFSLTASQTVSDVPLQSAIDQACLRFTTLQQAASQQEQAGRQLTLAEKNRLPSAAISGSARYQSDAISMDLSALSGLPIQLPQISGPHYIVDFNLGLQYPLLSGGRLQNAVRLGRLAVSASGQQTRLVRSQLAWEVKQLFIADRLLQVQEQSTKALKNSLDIHQRRLDELYQAGLSSMADRIQSQEKSGEIELSLLEIARNRLLLADRFYDLTGMKLDDIAPALQQTLPDPQELATLIDSHPGLEIKRIEEQRSRTQEDIAKADYRPQATLFTELHGGSPGVNMLDDQWSVYGVAGISLRLTLFDFDKKAELTAIHRLQQKQWQFEQKRQKEQLEAAVSTLCHQIESLELQQAGNLRLIELAEQFLVHQERLWRENQASHSDYLTALEHLSQQRCRPDQTAWQIERLKSEIMFTLAQ